MKLVIENLAKVAHAEIALRGITLISGENDSGKSTCGKAICTMLNVFEDLDGRVGRIRLERLGDSIRAITKHYFPVWDNDAAKKFLDGNVSSDDFVRLISRMYRFSSQTREKITELKDAVEVVRDLKVEDIRRVAIQRGFASTFHDQYLPLYKSEKEKPAETSVTLESDDGKIGVVLKKNSCSYVRENDIRCGAWYVGSPDVVDQFGSRYFMGARNWFDAKLIHAVGEGRREALVDPIKGAFDASMNQKALKVLATHFKKLNDDELSFDREGGYVIKRKEFASKLLLSNASMGTKSIALIRILIESGVMKSGDLLVLDEPEIHLHPEWQLIYAELVVLLRKELGVYVLLTTHSPDFTQAVRVYSKRHGIADEVSAYLTTGTQMTKLKPVKGPDWDELFEKYIPTVKLLEELAAKVGV